MVNWFNIFTCTMIHWKHQNKMLMQSWALVQGVVRMEVLIIFLQGAGETGHGILHILPIIIEVHTCMEGSAKQVHFADFLDEGVNVIRGGTYWAQTYRRKGGGLIET